MVDSLFGKEFDIPDNSKAVLSKLKETSNTPTDINKVLKSKKLSITERLALITENVNKVLEKQINNVLVIDSRDKFHEYITKAINFGKIAIDTETNNSLDPITCKLMGLCLYYPGEKQVYVPINHTDLTDNRLAWQLTEADCKEELQRLVDNKTFIIMHNGKFDYQVIKCTCNIKLPISFDTMIAARLINENELSAGLKQQYISKIDSTQEKYSIEHLFTNIEYKYVDPNIFALYAATDSLMTYKLYEWQLKEFSKPELAKVYNLFKTVEMPCVEVVAEMELNGVEFDTPYAARLKYKYELLLEQVDLKIKDELKKLSSKITAWKLTPEANLKETKNGKTQKSKAEQLEDPINLDSPTQLAILFYDILKLKVVDKKAPRGTGEECLKKFNLPLSDLLLERRSIVKLLDAFILSLPENVNAKDGRIHCKFNQLGTDTGRFSSSNPNLQQIPSHNKELRLLFKAKDGYTLVGNDFGQQEPRLLAYMAQDQEMINAYKKGKDLYATIAAGVYHNKYEDNLEFAPDGSLNPDGKKRRQSCKAILLGIMYGRGAAAIAEQTGSSLDDAKEIINNFYKSFPKVKIWMDNSQTFLKHYGYVEDFLGRQRRLPDINLKPYEVYPDSENPDNVIKFNPFLHCENRVDNKLINYYIKRCSELKSNKEYEKLKAEAADKHIIIQANTGRIAQAERQCVNARIQGSAATMTKIAMNKIYRDPILDQLKFKLLIGVHDELIGECPKENADKVAERLSYIMINCISDICDMPFKSDADIADSWYLNDYKAELLSEYNKLCKEHSKEESKDLLYKNHIEQTKDFLEKLLFEEN